MAGSSAVSLGLQYNVRSISLPCRLHPNSLKIESEINKLKTIPLTTEAIRIRLIELADLYNSVEELIQSPLTQQALLHHQHGKLVEEALEGSVQLLDSCGTIKDLFFIMKENVQHLQSALRRKGGDASIQSNVGAYICFRKKAKKDVGKSLRVLKQMENKIGSSLILLDVDHHLSMVIKMVREITAITISIFRSLLLLLNVNDSKSKPSGWSLISKLMMTRSGDSERGHQMIVNEVGSVDLALYSLQGSIRNNDAKVDVQMARRRLETLDSSIEGLEAGLDCLFRRLIKCRVSLLNIFAC